MRASWIVSRVWRLAQVAADARRWLRDNTPVDAAPLSRNDNSLGALESALEDFPGCAVVISHDRFFLDRLAIHILAFESDSQVDGFEGNVEAYEEDKKRRLGADCPIPHRIKFQNFTR